MSAVPLQKFLPQASPLVLGCMGLGVAWFAWSGLYLVTLIAGLIALLKARDNQNQRPVTWPLMGQLAGGLALGIYWFIGVSGVS